MVVVCKELHCSATATPGTPRVDVSSDGLTPQSGAETASVCIRHVNIVCKPRLWCPHVLVYGALFVCLEVDVLWFPMLT
jgi:hypothetical protein